MRGEVGECLLKTQVRWLEPVSPRRHPTGGCQPEPAPVTGAADSGEHNRENAKRLVADQAEEADEAPTQKQRHQPYVRSEGALAACR